MNIESEIPEVNIPVKWLEVPIQKFNTAVPHFVDLLKDYHNNIDKLKRLDQCDNVDSQFIAASKTASQLMSLVIEMDNLRDKVADSDVVKFDKLISDSKQSALSTIQSHKSLSQKINNSVKKYASKNLNTDGSEGNEQDHQLQLIADLSEDIRAQEQRANSLERIQEDVEKLQDLYQNLADIIHEEGEIVNAIENSTVIAHHNVLEGESQLRQAAKYKSGTYPLIGAMIGSILGGPVGLLAGLKIGGLTALCCGVLGFTGGKILRNQNEVTITEAYEYRKGLADK